MTKKTRKVSLSEKMAELAVKGIQEKKGKDILVMDLRELSQSVCDFFIICTGDSSTQVSAIAGSVEDFIEKEMDENPWHVEGLQASQWVLIDYVDIVVHVFQPEFRDFYKIENLWADAKMQWIT